MYDHNAFTFAYSALNKLGYLDKPIPPKAGLVAKCEAQ